MQTMQTVAGQYVTLTVLQKSFAFSSNSYEVVLSPPSLYKSIRLSLSCFGIHFTVEENRPRVTCRHSQVSNTARSLCNPKVHCCVHKNPILWPRLSPSDRPHLPFYHCGYCCRVIALLLLIVIIINAVRSHDTCLLITLHGNLPKRHNLLMGKICRIYCNKKQTPWPLVRKRTIPTERPPLVGEI
jgi:hypothetical protein